MQMPNMEMDPGMRRRAVVLVGKLVRTKNPATLEGAPQKVAKATAGGKPKLQKCLTTLDLTSLGVGSCVGTGMYLVAGMVARNHAGPGVVFSFLIAAVASIFSGVCYAEFGVRVPHTTGSAYMYSYVTVGEFLAFVIGWNMVLEYLIGTSACACALSACFDTLSNGAISSTFAATLGTIFGRPPDILAFLISIFMTILMVAGVKKSLVFNNLLNAINLSIWVFIMGAGLFYVDTKNWSEHKGFTPMGWSGVLTGAATCFYAFIGFDIIATTGEEAHNPKRDIPLAIISSLVIILTAYVTSSMMLTLIIPYDEIDPDSALVEMFAQRGSETGKYIVSVGAIAGLTVSMFGSMFPMPRVVYAMAKDGLIFKFLAAVWPLTGTPAISTFIFGFAAAMASLLIHLEVLVEMMSIGTLLAYTLVSTCVLILRYQPERTTTLAEMLPESFKQLEEECGVVKPQQPPPQEPSQFSSWGDDEDQLMQDPLPPKHDQYTDDSSLVEGNVDPKSYGSVPDAAAKEEKVPGPLDELFRKLEYKFPAIFPWRDRNPATDQTGQMVLKCVGILYLLVFILDIIVVCDINYMAGSGVALFFIIVFFLAILGVLLFISRKPQNRKTLKFMTPGLPFIPAIAVTVNIYLIFKLHILTLVRFVVWMILGLFMYFCYGIKNSLLETTVDQNIEMQQQQQQQQEQQQQLQQQQQPSDDVGTYGEPAYNSQYDPYQSTTSETTDDRYRHDTGTEQKYDPLQAAQAAWGP